MPAPARAVVPSTDFKKTAITRDFLCKGVAVADLNYDSLPEIPCGDKAKMQIVWQRFVLGKENVPGTEIFSHGIGYGDLVIRMARTMWLFGKGGLKERLIKKSGNWVVHPANLGEHCSHRQILHVNDCITGKRFLAHHGRDPGDIDPPVLMWFACSPAKEPYYTGHSIDNDSGAGLNIMAQDMNDDRKIDIVIANKNDVFLFENKLKKYQSAVYQFAAYKRWFFSFARLDAKALVT